MVMCFNGQGDEYRQIWWGLKFYSKGLQWRDFMKVLLKEGWASFQDPSKHSRISNSKEEALLPQDLKRWKKGIASLWTLRGLSWGTLHRDLWWCTPTLQKCKVKARQEQGQKCSKYTDLSFSSLSSRLSVVSLIVQMGAEAESEEAKG